MLKTIPAVCETLLNISAPELGLQTSDFEFSLSPFQAVSRLDA